MEWLIYAIAAPAIYAVVNFIDKYIVGSETVDYRGMPIISALLSVLAGTLLWVVTGRPLLSFKDGLLVLLTGMLAVFAAVLYFKAVYNEAASKIIILMQMVPLFVLGLSVLFLHEILSDRQVVGFLIVFLTAGILTVITGKPSAAVRMSNGVFLLIICADLMWAVSSVLLKYLVAENAIWKIFIYQTWGAGLGGLILFCSFPQMRRAFIWSLRTVNVSVTELILLNEIVFVTGKLFNILALSIGPTALVSVLGGTQVFFGLIYGLILTKTMPLVYHEDISRRGLVKQLILAFSMFIGICLLY